MHSWSPELEFVARLSRLHSSPHDEARAFALAAAPLDWERLLRLAEYHGVASLVDANLSRLEIPSEPEGFRHRLRNLRLSSTRADLARYHCWLELCRAFEARGIPAMTLKGFHVVLSVYGQVGLRPVGDLDFLVRSRDVPAAVAVLEQLGYHLAPVWQAALRHVGLDHILASTGELLLVSARGVAVDLHWEAGPRGTTPSTEELFAGAKRLRVEDQDVLVTPPDVAIALLLLHGHWSVWARLRWLVDVAEGIERLSPAEYAATVRLLDRLGASVALASALAHIESLWGRLPVPSQHSAPVPPAKSWMLRHHRAMIDRDRPGPNIEDMWHPMRMLQDRLARAPSPVAAVALAIRPGRYEWAFARLPRSLRLGYYFLRPIGILRQALAKGGRRTATADPAETAVTVDAGQVPARHWPETRASVPFTFVSAIYDSGPSSPLGGRGWDISFYLPSLINIANLGAPIVLFCSPAHVRAIEDAIAPYFRDYRVIPYNLSRFVHFDAVMEWKPTYVQDLPINDRNEVLCFLKSYWVQQAIAEDPFGHDLYFWIDAGFTHHGIFPARVGGVELRVTHPASRYHPEHKENIFSPVLGAALVHAVTRGKVFFCALPFPAGSARREAYEQIIAARYGTPRDQVRMEEHLVGGLFGGHREDLRTLHGLYAELLKEFIDARTYTLEEQVFSGVHALHPELFSLRRFGTWYFYSPGERTSVLGAEGNSFYKIFTRLVTGDTAT